MFAAGRPSALDANALIKDEDAVVIQTFPPALAYPEPSALSARSPRLVSVLGNRQSDVEELVELGHLNLNELIMGQWVGVKQFFNDYRCDIEGALKTCPTDELSYYRFMLSQCLETGPSS